MKANEGSMSKELAFLVSQGHKDEAAVLAEAVREGVRSLYREALIESYLVGRTPRERLLREFGPEEIDEIDYKRDALRKDVLWALSDE
jgi:hypothetical protein